MWQDALDLRSEESREFRCLQALSPYQEFADEATACTETARFVDSGRKDGLRLNLFFHTRAGLASSPAQPHDRDREDHIARF
jgi:hypothetical protein